MRRVFVAMTISALAATAACSSSGNSTGSLFGGTKASSASGSGGGASTPRPNPGGGGSGTYCAVIESAKTNIDALQKMSGGSTSVSFGVVLNAINSATAAAPSSIKPSWVVLQSAFQNLVNALRTAGVNPDNLTDLSKLSPTQLQALESVSNQLDTTAVKSATDNIDAQVKASCGVDLNSGG